MKLRFTKYVTTEEAARAFLAAEKAKHPRRKTYAPQYVEYGSNSPMVGHPYAVHYFI